MSAWLPWIPFILVGLFAGFLCAQNVKGGGIGWIGDLVVGVGGAVLTPKLVSLVGLKIVSVYVMLLAAFLVATAFLVIFRIVSK